MAAAAPSCAQVLRSRPGRLAIPVVDGSGSHWRATPATVGGTHLKDRSLDLRNDPGLELLFETGGFRCLMSMKCI